ncbi:hypothetical protein VPHF99_0301 [Vibrio phage F99]
MSLLAKIKITRQRIKRQKGLIVLAEENFQGKVKLYNKAVGTEFHKKAFTLKDSSRTTWWKDIDDKVQLEQELKVLTKQYLETL